MASSSGLPAVSKKPGRMFRPHNRIFLRGQASRTERKKKRRKKKGRSAPGTPWMLAISRRETKIKQASKDFTVFSRPREILRVTFPLVYSFLKLPRVSYFSFSPRLRSSLLFNPSTRFNEVTGQRQFLNRVARSLSL